MRPPRSRSPGQLIPGPGTAPEHPAPLSLQVGTNGVISTQDFPRETQYVDDDFPTDFPVIAPFLADLDTSGDRGNIYYRQDDSPDVLDQAAGYIRAGFPRTAGSFVPTDVFIATWEDVGAYQELSQDTEPSEKLNTFQVVIAYDDEDTYAIFLYPEGGLQFLGTRPKESYNVQLELPARVGFSWGDGAEFTQSLEVTFYPGEETVQVTQTAEGLGPDNYLSLRTHIQGQAPFLPENVTVHIAPYEELYHYSSSGLPSVAPPSVRPSPRPDVSPPATGTFLLYAQGQQIGYLPLNGTRLQKEAAKTLLSLHGSIVVGIDYDCREKTIYWTDVAGRTISRASLEPGAEPETVINSGVLPSPVTSARSHLGWVRASLAVVESPSLEGKADHLLPLLTVVLPVCSRYNYFPSNLYWTDWNREAPKIETSTVSGANRRVLVNKDIGLPNGLTFDPFSKLLCWADAGTKHLECTFPDGTGRRVVQNNLNYPFSIISYANHFYHTDWRRDGVIAIDKETGSFTDEYLPEQRSHLYGITAVYPYCPGARK
nr:PREDICTED: nidogen-2 [Opisthocomus hoazin]